MICAIETTHREYDSLLQRRFVGANRIRDIFLLLCLFLSGTNAAFALPQHAAVPGGVAIVALGGHNSAPQVYYLGKRVMVVQEGGQWQAVVGVPLSAKPGRHTLRVQPHGSKDRSLTFTVSAKRYEEQHLQVPPRMVNPSPEDQRRIARDLKLGAEAYRTFQQADTVTTRFILPVEGRYSSPFGLRRFFNKEPRNPHSGIDLAAPTGTPIRAPASGRVIATGDLYYNGNTVFLDHGQGLVTMYCHLDSIAVKTGQVIEAGHTLGTVGATGRVTGPHLHWSVSLNDARVDPLLFLAPETVAQLQP
jgi:murein DD-endopeptidase MepM/ murein hydrolase activator NlpD